MKNIDYVKILVVGDIMLDKYIIGRVERISPEAPVPVVNVIEEYYTLGGCGNVVRNIRELGAQVDCMASIGLDDDGEKITNELQRIGAGNILTCGQPGNTTVKERIIADDRKVQMIRIDREIIKPVDHEKAIEVLRKNAKIHYDIIIVSDYAKGMITKEVMSFLKTSFDSPIIVDPKPINGFLYNDVFMITPNEKEWQVMQLTSQYSLKNVKFVLETKGKSGMIMHDITTNQHCPIKSEVVDVYNVSGAGDTVVAIMGICISLGHPVLQAAMIANKCAAYVVTQSGTSTVPKSIFKEVSDMFLREIKE